MDVVAGLKFLFGFATATTTVGKVAVLVGRIILIGAAQKALAPKPRLPNLSQDKLLTQRSPIAAQRLIYGEDLVSGPLMFSNVGGSQNNSFFTAVPLCGHEADDITDVWFDGDIIADAQIDDLLNNPTPTFEVLSGSEFRGNPSLDAPTFVERRLGDLASASTLLNTAFPGVWTSAHQCFGKAHLVIQLDLVKGQESVFQNGAPNNYRGRVRGKVIYDPRLDDTNGGTGPHRLDDDTTWEWSDNNALQTADYLKLGFGTVTGRNPRLGMAIDHALIDWPAVITAADRCDATVTVPDGMGGSTTQKRYTSNVTLSSNATFGRNLGKLVDGMLGWLTFSQGEWIMYAGGPQTATVTLDGSYLRQKITVQAQAPHDDRYNLVRGNYVDPGRDYQSSPYLERSSSVFATDDGEVIDKKVDFQTYQDEFACQRGALITLRRSRRQMIIVWEGNWKCFEVQPGRVINVTVPDLLLSNAPFLCTDWKWLDNGGVDLTLVEWDDADFDDPALGEYEERTDGVLNFQDFGIAAPTSLSAVRVQFGHTLFWTSPPLNSYKIVEVFASDDNDRNNATKVGETVDSQFGPIFINKTQYYWVRARNKYDDLSDFEPAGVTAGIEVLIDIPAVTNLAFESDFQGVLVTLVPPAADKYDTIQVWSSADNDRNNAVLVLEFRGDRGIVQKDGIFTRFYWARAAAVGETGFSEWNPVSSTAGVQVTGGQSVVPVVSRKLFEESFESYSNQADFEQQWEIITGTPTIAFPAAGKNGGKVLEVTGDELFAVWRTPISYDLAIIHKLVAEHKRTVAETGDEDISFGVVAIAQDGVTVIGTNGLDDINEYHANIVNAFDTGAIALDEWQRYLGYMTDIFTGAAGFIFEATAGEINARSQSPHQAHKLQAPGALLPSFFRPFLHVNQGASPTTVACQIDNLSIGLLETGHFAPYLVDPNLTRADDDFWWVINEPPGAGDINFVIEVGGGLNGSNTFLAANLSDNSANLYSRHGFPIEGVTIAYRVNYLILDNASGVNASSNLNVQAEGFRDGLTARRFFQGSGDSDSDSITAASLTIDGAWHTATFSLDVSGFDDSDFWIPRISFTSANAADDVDVRIGRQSYRFSA